jgi:3-polyprenyl-4-hydroxybenzoate decarboxylase
MTPQERFDYKAKWLKSSAVVTIHSDYEYEAKRWCKDALELHQWHFVKYTNIYEDTFYFEHAEHAHKFDNWCIERHK